MTVQLWGTEEMHRNTVIAVAAPVRCGWTWNVTSGFHTCILQPNHEGFCRCPCGRTNGG